MHRLISFSTSDLKTIISKLVGGLVSDVSVFRNNNGETNICVSTELSENEIEERIEMLNNAFEPCKAKDHWHPYSIVIWNEDDAMPSGTSVIAADNLKDAEDYVRKTFKHSLDNLQADKAFKVIYSTSDYNENPSDCCIVWEGKSGTRFSTHWCITENAELSEQNYMESVVS